MSCLGNIIWFIFGGFVSFISWAFIGLLLCLTIIGIPLGIQCFKMARLSAAPFGKEVYVNPSGGSLLINILWIIFGGLPLATSYIASGIVLCLTIIGIPFGIQQFKMVALALFPFGAEVLNSNVTYGQVHVRRY
ncbi:YccF domain-containing protein [Aerococcaceae bacterium DSM 111022]|nr:YccF domain-containing protein [Aerococcaceae bacterium DSM 111022]